MHTVPCLVHPTWDVKQYSEEEEEEEEEEETLWTQYVVDYNMPFTSSDDFTEIVKKMFFVSKIATLFSHCRCTKTTEIARTSGQRIRFMNITIFGVSKYYFGIQKVGSSVLGCSWMAR